MERDPSSAASEYMAEFRTDVEAFVSREAVEACISRGIFERAPIAGVKYFGFCDPSGGSSDPMTLAISHLENDVAIVDAVRERRPPFSPEAVVSEFADVLRCYRIETVRGDRYAGEWPREAFRKHGIDYRAAAKPKSEIYLSALPAINSRRVDLLDHPRIVTQFCSLERRTSRGGRDSIDHRPGAHDDTANAVAGALMIALERPRWETPCETGLPYVGSVANVHWIDDEFPEHPVTANWRRQNLDDDNASLFARTGGLIG